MRRIERAALAAVMIALVMGSSVSALPQGVYGPGMMGGPGMMRGPGMMGGRGMGPGMMMGADPVATTERRLAGLKSALAITSEQEPAWSDYAETVRAHARSMAAHRTAMAPGGTTVPPEQRLGWRQQGMAQRHRAMQAFHGLFSLLTPDQQQRLRGVGMGYPWP
jgi:hypothetical protein